MLERQKVCINAVNWERNFSLFSKRVRQIFKICPRAKKNNLPILNSRPGMTEAAADRKCHYENKPRRWPACSRSEVRPRSQDLKNQEFPSAGPDPRIPSPGWLGGRRASVTGSRGPLETGPPGDIVMVFIGDRATSVCIWNSSIAAKCNS